MEMWKSRCLLSDVYGLLVLRKIPAKWYVVGLLVDKTVPKILQIFQKDAHNLS